MLWTPKRIRQAITEGKLYRFYKGKEWIKLKTEVLKEHHNECMWCKEKGIVSRAVTVHHVQFVKKHPELALSKYYTYQGQQYNNLVPLCHDCHDKAHKRIKYKPKQQSITEERW